MQRLLHEGMDAGLCGFSIQRLGRNSTQADFDGTPMVTDTMCDEDILCPGRGARRARRGLHPDHPGDRQDQGTTSQFVEKLAAVVRPADHPQRHRPDPPQPRPAPQVARLAGAAAGTRACRSTASAPPSAPASPSRLENWNLYDFSKPWRALTTGTHEEKLAKMADPELREAHGRRAETATRPRYRKLRPGVGGPLEKLIVQGVAGQPGARAVRRAARSATSPRRGQAPHRGDARPVAGHRPQGRVPRPGQGLERRVHGRADRRRPTRSPACPTAAPTPSSSPAAPGPPTS